MHFNPGMLKTGKNDAVVNFIISADKCGKVKCNHWSKPGRN